MSAQSSTVTPTPTPTPSSVPTDSLRANPHNPRMLFDPLPLKTLEESIERVGVLVPLTVFKAAGSQKYTILDGQRRWICAQRLKLPTVPINEVKEPSVAQNIVTMFQIHKLRKDWELMPTALKLEVLMDELKERRDAQLADLTGLDIAVVTRCKKLLSYSNRYRDLMLFQNPADRIKADFFIELYPVLNDRLVAKASWFNENTIIDRFIEKYQNKLSGFKAITDFRKIKQYISVARAASRDDEILFLLERFIRDDNMDISELEIDTARVHRESQLMVRSITKLSADLESIDADAFLGEEELWLELENFLVLVKNKLALADRRPQ